MRIIGLLIMAAIPLGCTEVFFPPEPKNNPVDSFEVFWNDFDRYYSFFEYKQLNWDSIYRAKRPLITSTMSDNELFGVFDEMIQYLQDGHADLRTQTQMSSFDFAKDYPANKLSSVAGYLILQSKSRSVSSGIIGSDIGYLSISSFEGSSSDFEVVDGILRDMKTRPLKGIIIDVRGNGGGSDSYSRLVANRFTGREQVYSHVRYKAGPSHNDFGAWSPKSITPEGEQYSGKVMVLTNRRVFSAAEDFVLAMRVLPTVTVVGDTTGGGSGNPLQRTLPNGWRYRVPRWQQVDAQFEFYEGKGLNPDLPIWISEADRAKAKDTILEAAMMELRK